MSDTTAHAEPSPHRVALAHVVPLKFMVAVWATLIFLTIVTVGVTYVDLGSMNLVVAMLIATVKGTLVCLYFMHLRWDRPLNAIVFGTALLMLAIFITIALLDTTQYQHQIIP